MLSSYKTKLKRSIDQRRQITLPPTGWLVALTVVGLLVYILIAILVAPDGHPEYHFDEETGIITVCSAILLAMTSAFAGTCFILRRNDLESDHVGWLRSFWLLTAFAFFFFAFDELLQFHELVGAAIQHNSPVGPSQTFRNWNDAIVIGYGVVAISVIMYFLPEILRLPKVAEILAIALTAYAIHTTIDSTQARSSLSIIFEESCKLFTSAFLALSMLFGILAIVASQRNSQVTGQAA